MPAYLSIKTGDSLERIECQDIVTMGRDGTNTVPIKDPELSRNHAMVRSIASDQFYIFDTGSRNGSFVNGLRISAPTLLKPGDIITLGNTSVVFEQFTVSNSELRPTTESMTETIRSDFTSIKQITVLVADIRGYTEMAEQVSIKLLSELMSAWFEKVQKIVESNGGRVDKFIGDCVMAIWDLGEDPAPQVKNSVRAAFDIYMYTGTMHEKFSDLPKQMTVGAGINTGQAAVGIGADNTAMGDTVNLAFRLETASKTLDRDLVLSKSSYDHLPHNVWKGREQKIEVKGKKGPIQVCALQFTRGKSGLSL